MARFFYQAVLGAAVFAAAACSKPQPATTAEPPNMSQSQQQLEHVFERYWNEHIAAEGAIAPQTLADALSVEKSFLAEALVIPLKNLDAAARLDFNIFVRQRELRIQGYTYPAELLPLNPFGGMPLEFAAAAADFAQTGATVADYDNWLRGVDAYVDWTRQATLNMRDGVRRGYTQPRALVERMLPLLAGLGSDDARNVFYTPAHSIPASFSDADKLRLSGRLNDAVAKKLVPASRGLREFLQQEYLPRAREGLGLSDLPLGEAWYAYLVRRATGSTATAAEIHRIGESEVQRLHARLLELRAASDAGPLEAPLSAADLLQGYEALETQVIAALPMLIAAEPPAPYRILAAAFVQDPTVPVFARARTIYVDPKANAARVDAPSFLANAMPGVLYQATWQRRLELPKFRRYGYEPAFVQGWGLYAAALGDVIGAYRDDAARYRAAALDMRCSVALVIDTGLHAQHWTRAQALDYLHAQMPMDDATAQAWIDKYAAMPGDALACKWGAMQMTALRAKAQQVLGSRFAESEFNAQVLAAGALPPDLLESRLRAWLEAAR